MGIKGFSGTEQSELTATQIVDETLIVHSNGSVTFRTRRGKGSGKAVEIAGDEFDTFVTQMSDIASRRETLAAKARTEESVSTEEVSETSSE